MKKARKGPEATEAKGANKNTTETPAVVVEADFLTEKNLTDENLVESHMPVVWIEVGAMENDSKSELDWVRDVLELHFDLNVIRLSDWQLGITQAAKQLQPIKPNLKTRIVIASRFRSDAITQFLSGLQKLTPTSDVTYLLGQWWAGHKRTSSLPSGIRTYYWYQLYDGFLGDFGRLQSSHRERESALVISSNPELRRMWTDSLPNDSIHVTSLIEPWSLPDSPFSYILIDTDTKTSLVPGNLDDQPECSASFVRILRRRYPNATIAVMLGFPEWSTSRSILEAGAEIVIGKPFHWSNLLSSLRSHSRRSASPSSR